MRDVTLHPTPRRRDVLLEQLRMVGVTLRPAALIVAAVLAFGTVMVGGEIIGGGRGFDSNETFPTALVAFLFPFAVWRNEKRFGPAFLWTLPVERRLLALAKVLAGFVWFMVALAFFVLWLLVLGLLAGAPPEHTIARVPFITTIAMYLFGSALVLGLKHHLRWLVGAAGVRFLMGTSGEAIRRPETREWRYVPGADAFFSAISEVRAAWLSLPDSAQWTLGTFLWIAASVAALWAALSRHRERRRH
ncbi:MAG TPA: hypothetical protein VGF48_15025 [Thermoanaerobaculia bacterium]|jgi:ABC-type multidrug transport system permease subunit